MESNAYSISGLDFYMLLLISESSLQRGQSWVTDLQYELTWWLNSNPLDVEIQYSCWPGHKKL